MGTECALTDSEQWVLTNYQLDINKIELPAHFNIKENELMTM